MSFTPTEHPVIPVPTQEQAVALGPEGLVELLEKREELIRREKEDPYRYGYIPDHWKEAERQLEECDELLIMGGNRSGKSTFVARRVIDIMLKKTKRNKFLFFDFKSRKCKLFISRQGPLINNRPCKT